MRLRSLSALLGLCVAWPASAFAGPGAGVTASFFARDEISVFTPELHARVPAGAFDLEATWAFSMVSAGDVSEFVPQNPMVAAMWGVNLAAVEIAFGGGVSIPLADAGDPNSPSLDLGGVATALNTGMHAGYNPWLYASESFGLIAPARVDFGIPGFTLKGEAALFYLLSTGDTSESEIGIQAAAEFAFPIVPPLLDVGIRAQTVLYDPQPVIPDTDSLHIALEPFVQAALGPALARVGFLLPVTEPFGFAFGDGKFWGLTATVGLNL